MSDRNKRKVNKNRLCSSCSTPVGSDPSIFCDSCGNLTHGSCSQLLKEKIELLEQTDGAMWLCTSCHPTMKGTLQCGLANINANIENCMTTIKETMSQSITRNEALITETSNRFDELRDIGTETNSTIQQNLAGQESRVLAPQTNHASYASALGHPQNSKTHTAENIRQRKPKNILIVVNTKNSQAVFILKKNLPNTTRWND